MSLEYIYKTQKELSLYSGIGALLGWDQMTYMPQKGFAERSDQLSLISRLAHERVVSDTVWNHIQILTKQNNFIKLTKSDRLVVKRLEKDIEKARKVPAAFIEDMTKTTSLAYEAWEKARKQNNFSIFSPYLKKIFSLKQQYCDFINLPGHPYNNLLDDYEEGMTVEKLKREFSYLKSQINHILLKIKASERFNKQKDWKITFDKNNQEELVKTVLKKMFLPDDRSRIDISTHPFTVSMGNDDVRITTNFDRDQPLFAFSSTIHEAGHALYELGMPKGKFKNTVISDSPSLGLHESQSRFWENMIGKNNHFLMYFYPIFKQTFPSQLKSINLNMFYFYINQVKPSLIRIESDELTYCLHVILRFELEMDMLDEKLSVKELPNAWNEKIGEFLGITPKNDTEGILQDMHWSGGEIGYFPTYAIGSIYASQLYNQLLKDHPTTTEKIEHGNFKFIIEWLRNHVHNYGRKLTADEIIKKSCGTGLNSRVFVNYLKNKYYDLYEI
jgi:carboxypeptidase Taq